MYARISILLVVFLLMLFSSCQEKKADFFERDAREYTAKNCPQKFDDYTRLDSIVFVKGGEMGDLKLYFSITMLDDITRAEVKKHLSELGKQNLKVVRNSVLFAKHKEAGVSFTYIYTDEERGDKIAEYHFTKQDYK